MRWGQITEEEAARRGLMADALAERTPDGRVLVRHHATGLEWRPLRELAPTVSPVWRGGLPA